MSAEEARPARSERRRRKAEGDVRRAHADLLVVLSRFGGKAWQRPLLEGWSPAETFLHCLRTAEFGLEGLRTAAASGVPARAAAPSLFRSFEKRLVLMTWRLPPHLLPESAALPSGVILKPETARKRVTAWAADYLQFLQDQPLAYLANLRFVHSRLGPMDPFEWARFLRIYVRHYDLRLRVS